MGTALIQPKQNGGDIRKLTHQQQMFVFEMLANDMCNATEAARKAGYSAPAVAANKNLKNKRIAAILGKEKRLRIERLEMDADRILKEVEYCALRDPIDLCDEDGHMIVNSLKEIPAKMRRCIDSLKQTTKYNPLTGEDETTIEVKLVPKATVLRMAMEHFGLFAPKQIEEVVRVDWPHLCTREDGMDPIEEAIDVASQPVK